MPREPLPSRRRNWTTKGVVDGQTFHLSFGEYADGRLGEIWIDASKQGTSLRGITGALARMTSMALQCGADVREVVGSLRGLNFPPHGQVIRGDSGQLPPYEASSVADWIAEEIARAYLDQPNEVLDSDTRPLVERVAGPPRNADTKGDGRPPE